MLAKFETKSSRVKGISFHPTRPWLLCSLHDGQIQLWDYRMGTLLETFSEHSGPVRSVDFHSTQPLFVSGGDDYKIRVWNYNNKRSLFTLMGHLDYIRSVQFHWDSPWIVSCSDDQNIRIWNWQSRECIAVLTGHNHYVMSAQFHPKEEMVVSASLDQTIRVWDISGLKQKGKKTAGKPGAPSSVIGRLGTDLVGTVKYVLEGHERGVNWASFHPELPLIVSGSDDRMIKIWRTNETKAWEVDTLRGHTNNVSCTMFHPREDLILSNSEDHSIRVWDSTKRIGIQSFVRAHDRFWIITAHKTQNLIAAGHDTGTVVFKLRRERTPFVVFKSYCFYVKDRYYRIRELDGAGRDIVMMPITRGPAATNNAPRSLQFNIYCPNEFMLLMHNTEESGTYELISCNQTIDGEKISPEVKSGSALSVCFLTRNKFVTLESHDMLFIRNSDNIVTKRIPLPISGCTKIYNGGISGRILLSTSDQLVLFDTSSFQLIGSLTVTNVKQIQWCSDNSLLAVKTSNSVFILTKDLSIRCFITENQHMKDVMWEEHGVLLYTTLSQLKYLLPSGEKGVVRSFDDPVYLASTRGNTVIVFNRDNTLIRIQIDSTEYLFKLCLEKQQYREAIRIIRNNKVDSHAIISYLQRNGYEDIALYFVTEPRARFNLAIRSGKLDIAQECALQLNEVPIWTMLADEALRQGNHEIVEKCYQQTKCFEKLSFLYVIRGNQEKLMKMMKIAELRKDLMSRFYNSMLLGDVESRIQILIDAEQITLAYITAVTYGFEEISQGIKTMMIKKGISIPQVNQVDNRLMPPTPVQIDGDCILEMPRSTYDRVMEEEIRNDVIVNEDATEYESIEEERDDVDDDDDVDGEVVEKTKGGWENELGLSDDADVDDADGWGDDLNLSDEEPIHSISHQSNTEIPLPGIDFASQWCQCSSLAYDHAAAGNIDSACQLLHRQIGLQQVKSLNDILCSCYMSVHSTTIGFASMPSLNSPILRSSSPSLPYAAYRIQHATQLVKMGLKCFQAGRFEDTMNAFKSLLVIVPLVIAISKEEEIEIKQYVDIAKEYIIAVQIELERRDASADITRSLALSAYMTHCKLQNPHLLLTLNSAMVAAFKAENYIDAASFANRILSNPEIKAPRNASLEQKAKKVLQRSEREGRNSVSYEYSQDKSYVLDCVSMKPMYRGEDFEKCPFCSATFAKENKKTLCTICGMSQVGVDTVGLVCVNARK